MAPGRRRRTREVVVYNRRVQRPRAPRVDKRDVPLIGPFPGLGPGAAKAAGAAGRRGGPAAFDGRAEPPDPGAVAWRLDPAALGGLPPGRHADGAQLEFVVHARGGRRFWRVTFKPVLAFPGRPRARVIEDLGDWPETSAAEARRAALELRAKIYRAGRRRLHDAGANRRFDPRVIASLGPGFHGAGYCLYLRVSGVRNRRRWIFQQRYHREGRLVSFALQIGEWPNVTLGEARALARRLYGACRTMRARGSDPHADLLLGLAETHFNHRALRWAAPRKLPRPSVERGSEACSG